MKKNTSWEDLLKVLEELQVAGDFSIDCHRQVYKKFYEYKRVGATPPNRIYIDHEMDEVTFEWFDDQMKFMCELKITKSGSQLISKSEEGEDISIMRIPPYPIKN